MTLIYSLVIIISAFVVAFAATGGAYAVLKRYNILDNPVERSNHTVPTPRGGGIAIVLAMLSFLLVVSTPKWIMFGVIGLAVVSFLDDLKPVAPRIRLAVQALAVFTVLLFVYEGRVFLEIVPYPLELIILALGWMWFINLFNFMDGSDGLASSEAVTVSLGLLLLGWIVDTGYDSQLYSMVLVGSALGFALWNWHPAKIFMGDVGSIPMGYLLGFILIETAGHGWWAPALILPAYFIADATLVLIKRGMRGEKFWVAHSEHAYQKAIRAGMSHDAVARWVIAFNVVLWVLAAFSTLSLTFSIACTILAYIGSIILIVAFKRGGAGLPQAA